MGSQCAGCLPGRSRRGRLGHDRDREGDPRARGHRPDVPRGHPYPARLARPPATRRRAPRAGDRRAGRPGRGARHRGGAEGVADPAPQGAHPRRPSAAVPRRRGTVESARGRGDRPDLAVRDAPVGVARRTAARAACGDHRRRHVGHEPGGLPRRGGARGGPRLSHPRAGARGRRVSARTRATCPA